MGRYSSEARNACTILDKVIEIINEAKTTGEGIELKLAENKDVLAECIVQSNKSISSQYDEILKKITTLKTMITNRGRQIDERIAQEENTEE